MRLNKMSPRTKAPSVQGMETEHLHNNPLIFVIFAKLNPSFVNFPLREEKAAVPALQTGLLAAALNCTQGNTLTCQSQFSTSSLIN